MAGLLTYATGGIGLFIIGASETLTSTSHTLNQISNQTSLSPQPTSTTTTLNKSNIKSLIFTTITLLSILFILNSFISLTDAVKSHDQTGVVLQLEVVSISLVFLLFSVLGLLTNYGKVYIPVKLMDVLCLFGFVEEFYMFYIQKKDGDGIENRYYDLLLVPILVCIVSTLLELRSEKSNQVAYYSRLGRGVGLVMQGMWFVQMGVSFYSSGITYGCFMKGKSRGNFTIRCKGHPEFHRARAVATLQFNCHLALLVCFVCGVYSLLSRKYGVSNESLMYKPLGDEMQQRLDQGRFTLDSDEEEDVKDAAENVVVEKSVGGASEMVVVNGYGSHH
ncbi:transmembrane protein like protein [Tanacetum coccineum]